MQSTDDPLHITSQPRGRDPERPQAEPISRPDRQILWMSGFVCAAGALCLLVIERLAGIFAANPLFNGVILAVLAAGIFANFRQTRGLIREAAWIDWVRRGAVERARVAQPRLLAPLSRLLASSKGGTLAGPGVRAVLDSVQLRLDESRDLSRYLMGLAIFLGLLGTFWGLLVTIRSATEIISSLDIGTDTLATFAKLKDNLAEPISGMATSFSTSLFGLASSLIIGFLDLQSGHAQARFYSGLEDWLSSLTRFSTGPNSDGDVASPAYLHALLEQTADGLDRVQRAIGDSDRQSQHLNQGLDNLAARFDRLHEILDAAGREKKVYAETQQELVTVLRQLTTPTRRDTPIPDALRDELRLLTRTIATALDSRRQTP